MTRESPRRQSKASDGTGDHGRRLEPVLLRAAEDDNVEQLEEILAVARSSGQPYDHLLRLGLMRSAEKDKINATLFLLRAGANPDAPGKRAGPLARAVERGYIRIVKALLDNKVHPVDRNERDKKGRTVLMTAAWKNHWHICSLLINAGADVNAKDARGRNVMHNLAADKKCDWGQQVVELLLSQPISIDGPDAQDELFRTPLHWCSTTGKRDLAEKLLRRMRFPKANVNAVCGRQKTPLHMAAGYAQDDIVELLLEFGADVNARSDGCWTPLHNACQRGSNKIVQILLAAGADPNARLLNGVTPLHVAAEEGHVDVVVTLMAQHGIKRTARDSFGFTAFLRAAQRKHRECVNLLAPCNNFESLSREAIGACQGFMATVTDFGNYRHENKVMRMSVYELLYGKKPDNPRAAAFEALPNSSKATTFRWIHLPANNISWIEALMSKCFVEEGHHDVEGFKAIERSFNNQHHGVRIHSHFMRPTCQTMPRAKSEEAERKENREMRSALVESPVELRREPTSASTESPVPLSTSSSTMIESGLSSPAYREAKSKKPRRASMKPNLGKKAPSKEATPTTKMENMWRRFGSFDGTQSYSKPRPATNLDHNDIDPMNNIFLFSPFLHFETTSARKQMQDTIDEVQAKDAYAAPLMEKRISELSSDEMLLKAHLSGSQVSLHVRRTLDQFFYHNIDTESRDKDQVVYRWQAENEDSVHSSDPKIFMVDQLWMWVLGKDLIVTSFPQRWKQPRNDPLNVLSAIIEDVNSKTREPIKSVYDLALTITARCSGLFDRHRSSEGDYQFLDMFEASIGTATDKETVLFDEFNQASRLASEWLKMNRKPTRFSKNLESATRQTEHERRHKHRRAKLLYSEEDHLEPLFVDKLLDIGRETDLLAESKDIRDEINMISKVLTDQKQILPDMQTAICEIYMAEQKSQQEVKKRIRDQIKTIDTHLNDLARMDKQAERIYESITNLLDLKQKHANAFEARFARDQAAQTARQSQTIMVFTIVTIVFLPLTFMTGFLTLNVEEFPRNPNSNWAMPLSFASKYTFGIGIGVAIPLIAIALSLDSVGAAWRFFRRSRKDKRAKAADQLTLDDVKSRLEVQSVVSRASSGVRSSSAGSRGRLGWAGGGGGAGRDRRDGGHLLPVSSREAPSYRS